MTEICYSGELEKLLTRTPSLRTRIEIVTAFFPELDLIRFGRASKSAYYDPRSGTIRLTGRSSPYVIGHEITHLMQDGKFLPGGITPYPKGERSCDLYLFARSPFLVADVWDARDSCYLGKGFRTARLRDRFTKAEGQQMLHDVCVEAIRLREGGKRDYISWAEQAIAERIFQGY
ncbi:hypothetical protein [Methanocella sp. MCL-LM]|uniref:hypothetical protein n=1 Tax=Methanocella sp. MCL-LM TaxID=3412035 RepID=UPI003C7783ED